MTPVAHSGRGIWFLGHPGVRVYHHCTPRFGVRDLDCSWTILITFSCSKVTLNGACGIEAYQAAWLLLYVSSGTLGGCAWVGPLGN